MSILTFDISRSIKKTNVTCRAIDEAITRLGNRHAAHIAVYGKDNERRLTGRHETANVSSNDENLILTDVV